MGSTIKIMEDKKRSSVNLMEDDTQKNKTEHTSFTDLPNRQQKDNGQQVSHVPTLLAGTPDEPGEKETKPNKKSKKWCGVCKKKLKLTDITCKCGNRYCSEHRLSEQHSCDYDFKTEGRELLKEQNERIVGDKMIYRI